MVTLNLLSPEGLGLQHWTENMVSEKVHRLAEEALKIRTEEALRREPLKSRISFKFPLPVYPYLRVDWSRLIISA